MKTSMRMGAVICVLPLCALITQSVAAQAAGAPPRRAPAGELPGPIKSTLRNVLHVFGQPVHPVLGGVAPGSGFGAGIGYDSPDNRPLTLGAKAVVTHRKFWSAQADIEHETDRTHLEAYGRIRDLPQLAFYGFGDASAGAQRSNFALKERVAGGMGSVRVAPWVTLGGRAEQNWATPGPGESKKYPSIETQFDPTNIPGVDERARYTRYDGSVYLRIPAGLGEAFHQGGKYRAIYSRYDGQRGDPFAFTRIDLEAQHRFAMPIPQHRLTLHGWTSMTTESDGIGVPFFLQRTLGGKSFVRSVHDDLIGSDGSLGTLRGFDELRFRDLNLMLVQAEYRIPVWGLFDATAYVDAGKVARDRGDLDFSGLKHNFGVSLSAMKGDRTAARMDFAFGGGEGYRIFFKLVKDVAQ